MSDIKKEKWTEANVLALPAGEHDYFDRKSGALLTSSDYRAKLGKAISAFANSGGGHVILGIRDDGAFDGVTPSRGRTPTREWLEQIIPNLLNYPLSDFRVHEVIPDAPSTIPSGSVAIVVDVGDSFLAPHQAAEQRTYYYREGGHSKPAPHFYLETLRNRLVRPLLEAVLIGIEVKRAYGNDGGIFVEMQLRFLLEYLGRVAAYKWELVLSSLSGQAPDRDFVFNPHAFPRGGTGNDIISLDDTILPSAAAQRSPPHGGAAPADIDDG